jgi:t-SNARE complex subunit (syntaxin)
MNSRLHELQRDVHITIKSSSQDGPNDLSVPLLNPNDSPTPSRSDSNIYSSGSNRPRKSTTGTNHIDQTDSLLLATFFRDVDTVKSHLATIMETTKRILQAKEHAALPAASEHSHDFPTSGPGSIPNLVNETNHKAQRCKLLLQQFRSDLAEGDKKKEGDAPKAPTVTSKTRRIQQNLCQALTRKYVMEMQAYQSAQQGYKNSVTTAAHRQVAIVCPEATQEEVEELCRASQAGGDVMGKVAAKALLGARENAPPASAIRNAISAAENRFADVLVLEASLVELSQMFSDFSLMVEEQSELLDNIEFQTRAARDYLDDGLKDAVEAVKLQRKVRKQQCCIIGFVGSVVAVGILIVIKPFN